MTAGKSDFVQVETCRSC